MRSVGVVVDPPCFDDLPCLIEVGKQGLVEAFIAQLASLMPYFRQSSPADSPAECSFRTLMICSSVNLLLRISVSRRERTLPKIEGV